MDRYAIFVDAGYFFAAGANAAFNQHTTRKQVSLKSPQAMISDLCAKASAVADGLPLLRVYWYDAMPGPRLSMEQTALAMLNGIKLRLGALNSAGEQKGVDSLIVTDVIDLARNKAIAEAVLVTGDEDLRIAVQVAQSFGVRVHVLAAGDATKNVSATLQMEADSVSALDGAWFTQHFDLMSSMPSAVTAPIATASMQALPKNTATSIEPVARTVISAMLGSFRRDQLDQLIQHFDKSKTVPPEYDRPLIAKVASEFSGRRLTGEEMRSIRGLFVTAVRDTKPKS